MFNNKCVSSKNNSKGFWKMLRADKSRRNPSHFTDPVDKTTLIANKGKIEEINEYKYLGVYILSVS